MTQQCLQFERRWSPWHRLILRSRKPGANSLKDRLCEHLSSSVSCASVQMFQESEFSISCFATGSPNMEFFWYRWSWAWLSINIVNMVRDFDLCWRIAMIRDNCLVNISVADRFMKEAVYHIQVGYNVRSIVSMIFQLVIAMKQNRIFMISKWWSPVHCCRSSGCANCGLCAQHWLRGFQVLC